MGTAAELRKQIESALAGRIPAALSPRPLRSTELFSCGVAEVDALLGGGLPLGAIAELTGARSSGRTTLALSTLAGLTRQGHCCAYVDVCDALDPLSAAALGVELRRLLWVRPMTLRPPDFASRVPHICPSLADVGATRLDSALRATDLLLSSGGWGAVVLDLGDLPPEQARRVPLTTWYRFRLQAEKSRTLLLLIASAAGDSPTASAGSANDAIPAHAGAPYLPAPAAGAASLPRTHLPSTGGAGAPYLPSFGRYGSVAGAPTTCAHSCAAVTLHCHPASPDWRKAAPQSPPLLAGLRYRLSLQRSRTADSLRKKPAAAHSQAACGANSEAVWRSTVSWTG